MKRLYTKLFFIIFPLLIIISCQKDDLSEPKTNILFSVDLQKQSNERKTEIYVAAYTPEGELLNYGSIIDSTKWDLKAKYDGKKIDIVYFEMVDVYGDSYVNVYHIKNISVGQSFTQTKKAYYPTVGDKAFELKIEDFGNRSGNNTAKFAYMSHAYKHNTGNAYWGDFDWAKIEDGYTYTTAYSYLDNDPIKIEKGFELVLFERGTNTPYTTYIDLTNRSNDDIITLNKSDFTAAETKIVQVNAISDDYRNMFLYTYNSKTTRQDIMTSFDHHSTGNEIFYINNANLLPISHWKFIYDSGGKNTSYNIFSNKEIPSTFEIKELTGQVLTKNRNEYNLTHATIFPNKKLARSKVGFYKKTNMANFSYEIIFDSSESIGTTKVTPLKIPTKILNYNSVLTELNNTDWSTFAYTQTYTDIPNNSSLDYLKKRVFQGDENNKSNDEYIFENFYIGL
ncbi:hypothetical protein MCETHM1_01241 [Flavobacteriaceae bacterium]